ncbi:microcin C transport system substrate-binding protein [Limimonas halophila]|uniref:Microcin C transport system substrate-binding protein n=1 Tax=Limimonas halophila TaxID=1082479 RepID=A0A1G7UBJ7_9PROT|nr:extracellular solute-binding protein [Limimonas halophila]SDG44130.1 microcin C transport system substrate-binding protein [Limimonas halophila]
MLRCLVTTLILLVMTVAGPALAADTYNGVPLRHGVAMHGEVKYPADFEHFAYANPDAPQGGKIKLAAQGTYDSFNPYIVQGVSVQGAQLMYDTLMVSTDDEPFSEYGLVAEGIYMPEDRSWVAFKLREGARFHDGEPITPEDVLFSLNVLREKGHPFYRFYYKSVAKARKVGPRTVRFDFAGGTNRELPLILGQLPVLPKHYWAERNFKESTLKPPVGSGPYRVESFEPGRFVVYEKVDDYWAADLPVTRGRWNFAKVRYDYFRDPTVIRTAVKGGSIDFHLENQAKAWATAYDTPAVQSGQLERVEIEHDTPTGMQGFAMNTRRSPFDDPKVRRAMSYAFDFPWTNQNLFFGQYERTDSYFSNSELAAGDGPPDGRVRDILKRFEDELPDSVFTQRYDPPTTDGDGYPRENLKKALKLLNEAGWVVRDMQLVNAETGRPMRFEILLVNTSFERIVLPYVANLEKLGIEVEVRVVDSAQYQNRLDNYDFDMIVANWGQSLSPGNEQREFWGSTAAERPGSRNYTGVADPVVDKLIGMVIGAPSREALVQRVRALDRVLLSKHLVVPHWHIGHYRVVYWDKFGRPESNPPYGLPYLSTWWVQPDKARDVASAQQVASAQTGEGGGDGRRTIWTLAGLAVLLALAGFFWRRARGGREQAGGGA